MLEMCSLRYKVVQNEHNFLIKLSIQNSNWGGSCSIARKSRKGRAQIGKVTYSKNGHKLSTIF